MKGRWLMGLVAAVAVIAMAGVGFAAFTSIVTVNGSVTAGTAEIEWTGTPTTSIGGPDSATCTAPTPTSGGTVLTITITGFGPGDSCSIDAYILVESTSTDVTISSAFVASTNSMSCGTDQFAYFDSYSTPSSMFGPDTSHLDEINIALDADAVAACSGVTLTLTDTVTATWAP